MCSWQLHDFKKAPKISCVYSMTHEVSGREYIGRSLNLRDRMRKHWQELITGKHKNPKITKTYAKHGPSFIVRPIVIASPEYCEEVEEKLLAKIVLRQSLNCHRNSTGGWRGLEWSDEARNRLSKSRKGKAISKDAMARAIETRKTSKKWHEHQSRLQTPEAIKERCKRAAAPEARAKAVATRRKNHGTDFFAKPRERQIQEARKRLFEALEWAVKNGATRDAALTKFNCSWGSLKKFQPEWEAINGALSLPKRASGARWRDRKPNKDRP